MATPTNPRERRPRTVFRRLDGILLLDKPQGLSSNQALQRVRHLFRAEKGGHTGSLDPLATGLLPLCFGEATKLAGLLLGADKAYSIVLENPGSNKDVCSLTLNYTINGEKPIIQALNIWAYLHDPFMPVQRNDFTPPTDYKRITNSWEYYDEHISDGLVFVQLKKPDGSPVSAKADLATLLYSERKF